MSSGEAIKTFGPVTPPAAKPSVWSLEARLIVTYAASCLTIAMLASAVMYWALWSGLQRSDEKFLQQRIKMFVSLLIDHPASDPYILHEMDEVFENPRPFFVRILDSSDSVVGKSAGMPAALTEDIFPKPIGVSPVQYARSIYRTLSGKTFRLLAVKTTATVDGNSVVVQAAIDVSDALELLAWYQKALLIVLTLSTLATALLSKLIVRRSLVTLRAIALDVSQVDGRSLDYRVNLENLPVELMRIANAFNIMLERVEESYNRVRHFSDNLAHELRTPLNNMQLAADVALMKTRSKEDYTEFLSTNADECRRLAEIVGDLLFLAQAEHNQVDHEYQSVGVAGELERIAENFRPEAVEKGLTLTVRCPTFLRAELNRNLFSRAITNLITNAFAHTHPNDSVTLEAISDEDRFAIIVTDTGDGIAAEQLPYVFDRFYRADHIRSNRTQRIGLGLAIVKSIVELHGGRVTAASSIGKGMSVILYFPFAHKNATTKTT